jgi:2-polyprenyl-3-methyl-5-hydroxy-6-metoxy-1,4-benzoquinol methylase
MAGRVCPWWMAYTFDNPLRRLFHKPEKLLGPYVQEGMTVMDIGCGMGFFSLGMARLVGDGGRVLSVDIQQKMLDVLKKRAQKAGVFDRIQLVRCEPGAINVESKADFILCFWMVHEVPDSVAFFRQLRQHLSPKGKLLIAEPKNHVSDADFEKTRHLIQESGFEFIESPKISMSKAALFVTHGA